MARVDEMIAAVCEGPRAPPFGTFAILRLRVRYAATREKGFPSAFPSAVSRFWPPDGTRTRDARW